MLAVEHAVVVDGLELEAVEIRDRSRPGGDDLLAETTMAQARDLRGDRGLDLAREGGGVVGAAGEDRPSQFGLERAAEGGPLRAPELLDLLPDVFGDVLEQAQYGELAVLLDRLRTLEGSRR